MNLDQLVTQVFAHALTPQVKSAAGILDWAKDNPALATGVGTGLAGGLLTAGGRRQPGESRTRRTMRILRNALLTGGLGAGAVGALRAGGQSFAQALPADDVDPATRALTSTPLRGTLGLLGASIGGKYMKGPDPAKPLAFLNSAFETAVKNHAANPGSLSGAANRVYGTALSPLAEKILNGNWGSKGLGGVSQIFEGAGKTNINRALDELGTNTATREELLRNLTRAGVNTVERGGNMGNMLRRNLVEPSKILALKHLSPGRLAGIFGGAAGGYFLPDAARGVVDMASSNE